MRQRFAVLCILANCVWPVAVKADSDKPSPPDVELLSVGTDSGARLLIGGKEVILRKGESSGKWILVEVLPGKAKTSQPYAVLEDYSTINGSVIFVTAKGIHVDLPKSSEPTSADPSRLYLGHSPKEIRSSPTDLLAREILAKPGDPQYDEVAPVFEPLHKMQTYSFVGTPDTLDKVGFLYGGRSPNFDPAPYDQLNKAQFDVKCTSDDCGWSGRLNGSDARPNLLGKPPGDPSGNIDSGQTKKRLKPRGA